MNYGILINYKTVCSEQAEKVSARLLKRGFLEITPGFFMPHRPENNAVSALLAIVEIHKKYPWFRSSVKTCDMIHVQEETDLLHLMDGVDKINKKTSLS